MRADTRSDEKMMLYIILTSLNARISEVSPPINPIRADPPTEKIPGTTSVPRAASGILARNRLKYIFRIEFLPVNAGMILGICVAMDIPIIAII